MGSSNSWDLAKVSRSGSMNIGEAGINRCPAGNHVQARLVEELRCEAGLRGRFRQEFREGLAEPGGFMKATFLTGAFLSLACLLTVNGVARAGWRYVGRNPRDDNGSHRSDGAEGRGDRRRFREGNPPHRGDRV